MFVQVFHASLAYSAQHTHTVMLTGHGGEEDPDQQREGGGDVSEDVRKVIGHGGSVGGVMLAALQHVSFSRVRAPEVL